MQEDFSMNERNVIVLIMEGRYEFYGSPAALYSRHTADELGITQGGLNNYFCVQSKSTYKTYRNNKCEIIKGTVITNRNKK